MKSEDFIYISEVIKKRSGLALTEDKVYLLESRLQPIARNCGCKDVSELIALMRLQAAEEIFVEVTEAMTTNESMFFRDQKPFEQLKSFVLPRILEANAGSKNIRIWSAASSSGQEPYSVLVTLKEEGAKLSDWNIDMVGTDICKRVLEKAKKGIYTQFEVQRGLPITLLVKYFQQTEDKNWQLHEALRQMVSFRYLNLLDDFTIMGKFDIVLCRNVLIYFDDETKAKVLEKMAKVLNPHGVLYLGSTETIIGLTDTLKPIKGERGLFELA